MIESDSFHYDRSEKLISCLEKENIHFHEAYIENSQEYTLHDLLSEFFKGELGEYNFETSSQNESYNIIIKKNDGVYKFTVDYEILFRPHDLLVELNKSLRLFNSNFKIYKYPLPTDHSVYIVATTEQIDKLWDLGFNDLSRNTTVLNSISIFNEDMEYVCFSNAVIEKETLKLFIQSIDRKIFTSKTKSINLDRLNLYQSEFYPNVTNILLDDVLIGEFRVDENIVKFSPYGAMVILIDVLLKNNVDSNDFYFLKFMSEEKIHVEKSKLLKRIEIAMREVIES